MNETATTTGGTKAMSLLDATARVLSDADGPMRCKDIVDAVIACGLWAPGSGKTPDRTLCAAFQREIKKNGDASRFVKIRRGEFALRPKAENSDAKPE